jgi:hypothetical protein
VDELNLELQEEQSSSVPDKDKVVPSFKTSLIRTSAGLKICQLKKFILCQLKLEPKFLSKLVIRCRGDIVEDDFSLAFIQRTKWLVLHKDMVLTFSFNK